MTTDTRKPLTIADEVDRLRNYGPSAVAYYRIKDGTHVTVKSRTANMLQHNGRPTGIILSHLVLGCMSYDPTKAVWLSGAPECHDVEWWLAHAEPARFDELCPRDWIVWRRELEDGSTLLSPMELRRVESWFENIRYWFEGEGDTLPGWNAPRDVTIIRVPCEAFDIDRMAGR